MVAGIVAPAGSDCVGRTNLMSRTDQEPLTVVPEIDDGYVRSDVDDDRQAQLPEAR
ncbi:hypothetical protein GCM10025792_32330 [Pseudonocardia tropica]